MHAFASSLSSSWPVCYYPIPNHFRLRLNKKFTTFSSINNPIIPLKETSLTSSNTCRSQEQNHKAKNNIEQTHDFLQEFYSFSEINKTQVEEVEKNSDRGISTNMGWADLKAAIGQRINLEGIMSSVAVITRDKGLAVPNVGVKDVGHIDWFELKKRGFKGVVFDKDNTITAPYSLKLWGPLENSIANCKSVFGNAIAVFSNSAGLYEYDPDGSKARTLEKAIGIKVLRHRVKKPAGSAEEIEKHFGCSSSHLIMVGDRPFTDIVYGNRNGFLTILTEPLSLAEEPTIVKQAICCYESR